MSYIAAPNVRPRRLRAGRLIRELSSETRLMPHMLMTPYFVVPGEQHRAPIAAMPGISHLSVDMLVREVADHLRLGLSKVLLFGVPQSCDKDPTGAAAVAEQAVVPAAIRALRKEFGDAVYIATDVCLCGYTSHGHCGVMANGCVDNDASLPHLSAMAQAHALAGADMVAPSDMMDHRVGALRHDLDAIGMQQTLIMAYSAKYASAYYGPFREAASCTPGKSDRKTYQMDCRNRREALREVQLDLQEGADVVLVKPALAYLDIICQVRAHCSVPVACYNVSGEYSMVKAAAAQGCIDEAAVVRENLTAMARAGADILITYHGPDALRGQWLQRD
jgi:porphobilinogen synthase